MKKLWIVLLSLAMVAAFCMPASAVDVKFSGSYYVAGDYYSDINYLDKDSDVFGRVSGGQNGHPGIKKSGADQSTAFFRQRLRIQTEFVVSPGLSLITRFDALEKIWGDSNWTGSRSNVASRPHFASGWDEHGQSTLKNKEQENIEFEQAYIQYMSKIGLWWVGYAPHDFWGTTFGDSTQTQALVQWILPLNQNWTIGAKYFKTYEGSSSAFNGSRGNDSDDNAYVGIGMYKNENLEGGLKVAYRRIANFKDSQLPSLFPGSGNYPEGVISGWLLTPYFKGQFGPVTIQSELEYWNGDLESDAGAPDVDMEMWSFYLDGKVDIGPAYVGGRFIYASGQDWGDSDGDITGSNFAPFWEACWGGVDLKQTLILWNEDVGNWAGDVMGEGPGVKNAFFYQVYGGYKWNDFDFFASLAYAKADEAWRQRPFDGRWVERNDDDYGWELDVTATYKITNNLSYMVGAGYLWTGDYFKEESDDTPSWAKRDVDDIYVITNKLTLSF